MRYSCKQTEPSSQDAALQQQARQAWAQRRLSAIARLCRETCLAGVLPYAGLHQVVLTPCACVQEGSMSVWTRQPAQAGADACSHTGLLITNGLSIKTQNISHSFRLMSWNALMLVYAL